MPLEELRRRRERRELTGAELVWCSGMPDWQPLDTVLGLTRPKTKRRLVPWLIAAAIVFATAIFVIVVAGAFVVFKRVSRRMESAAAQITSQGTESERGVDVASRPVPANSHALTEADVRKRRRDFCIRQYLEAYRANAPADAAWRTDGEKFIHAWIEEQYGDGTATNPPNVSVLADRLAANPACNDPLVLSLASLKSVEWFEADHRIERAVAAFNGTKYKAYPRLFAVVTLAAHQGNAPNEEQRLDREAVRLFKESLSDGSILPEDQAILAGAFVNDWGSALFDRRGAALADAADEAGTKFLWLALALRGDFEINEAWKARGSGWANQVRPEGWQGFEDHLAKAESCLTRAWKLQHDLPLVPCLMERVELGKGTAEDMRTWFDRALEAQVDYPQAWYYMAWGLYPRWYGSLAALRQFGVTAIDSGRFDTEVPFQFYKIVQDLELENRCGPGEHLFGRPDIWPELQRMYNGYITNLTSRGQPSRGWREAYATVAYLARDYDASRRQLEQLDWQLPAGRFQGWGRDAWLLPLEVAARTSPLGPRVLVAERQRDANSVPAALDIYRKLAPATNVDARTHEFIARRIQALEMEKQLASGQWVNFLPATNNDPVWIAARGQYRVQPDGAVDIQADKLGFMLICEARIGISFEIEGEFQVISSSTRDFQAGLVMGLPEPLYWDWYAFRMKRNSNEGEVVSFSKGWGSQQVRKPVSLNPDHNTFRFRMTSLIADAWLNDVRILEKVQVPGTARVADDQFLVGLGSYNDMNNTVIRYRNVKLRRVIPGSASDDTAGASR